MTGERPRGRTAPGDSGNAEQGDGDCQFAHHAIVPVAR